VDGIDDPRIHRHQIAIGECEHRVEVHGGAELRHACHDHLLGGDVVEKRQRDLRYRLARGSFAHAHEYDAIADRHDVAALERGSPPVPLRIPPPHR
jgi:hypothetical protein